MQQGEDGNNLKMRICWKMYKNMWKKMHEDEKMKKEQLQALKRGGWGMASGNSRKNCESPIYSYHKTVMSRS